MISTGKNDRCGLKRRLCRVSAEIVPGSGRLVAGGYVLYELRVVVKEQRESTIGKVNPRVDVPFVAVAKTAFPEGSVKNLVLESFNVLETIVAPRQGDSLSLVVSYTLARRVSPRFSGFVVRNGIRDARMVLDSAYQDRARWRGVRPRGARRSSRMIETQNQEDGSNRCETKRPLHTTTLHSRLGSTIVELE